MSRLCQCDREGGDAGAEPGRAQGHAGVKDGSFIVLAVASPILS